MQINFKILMVIKEHAKTVGMTDMNKVKTERNCQVK